jgi:hypothetical protein
MMHEPFNKADFERIEIGMTEEEVEALLGSQPGIYSMSDAWRIDTRLYQRRYVDFKLYVEAWVGDYGSIIVMFDKEEEGRVVDKHFLPPDNARLSTTARIKYTMRRLWRRITGRWGTELW